METRSGFLGGLTLIQLINLPRDLGRTKMENPLCRAPKIFGCRLAPVQGFEAQKDFGEFSSPKIRSAVLDQPPHAVNSRRPGVVTRCDWSSTQAALHSHTAGRNRFQQDSPFAALMDGPGE